MQAVHHERPRRLCITSAHAGCAYKCLALRFMAGWTLELLASDGCAILNTPLGRSLCLTQVELKGRAPYV